MKTMSVTRALAELKRLDDRTSAAISSSSFVEVAQGRGNNTRVQTQSGKTLTSVISTLQSNKDKLEAMFIERAAIKAAIVKSNAETKVVIGARTMSVAEAIELKRSITYKTSLVFQIKQQLNKANLSVATLNEKLNLEIEANMAAIYGADKGKIDASAYESVSKPKKDQKEASVVDPLKVADWIIQLEEEISLVNTELDFTLSEINAKTEVTF